MDGFNARFMALPWWAALSVVLVWGRLVILVVVVVATLARGRMDGSKAS